MGMDDAVDPYGALGLPSGEEGEKLSEEEIKKAYRAKLLELHPDKRPDDDPNAHHNFLNLHTCYKILMDKKARQDFHHRLLESRKQMKRKRKSQQQNSWRRTVVDEKEQAARAAHSAAQAARDDEELIRRRNEQLFATIKRDWLASKAPPPAAAASTLNKGGAKEPPSTQCPCGHCQGDWLDRESSSTNFGGFEPHLNSYFRTKE